MERDELIQMVKEKYANIASDESHNFVQNTTDLTPEAYYEKLLQAVINEISKGTFDFAESADDVINKVAADKSILSEWQ